MTWTMLVAPKAQSVVKCLDLFAQSSEAFVKDIKLMISRSSFEEIVLPEIERINAAIESRFHDVYLLQPIFKRNEVTGRIGTALKRHPRATIRRLNDGFEIAVAEDRDNAGQTKEP